MRLATLIALLIAVPAFAATVWKWRDANGVIHYSDQQIAGAEKVNIGVASTYHQDPIPARSPTNSTKPATVDYSVQITSPASEETFPNAYQVSVGISISPALNGDDQLALYLDGQKVSYFQPQSTSYTINNVTRGEHSVAAAVLNPQGGEIKRSDTVRFYVTQPVARGK
jgi:hypothetical protein